MDEVDTDCTKHKGKNGNDDIKRETETEGVARSEKE